MNLSQFKVPGTIWLLLVYLLLLVFSWVIQLTFTEPNKTNKYHKSERIEYNGELVDVEYYLVGDRDSNSAALYFPDTYHKADFLIPLAEADTTEDSRIILNYPSKTLNGSDLSYSVKSRSEIASVFIDSLNIETLSVRGHGFGGLPAVELVSNKDQHNYRVKNLVMFTSFGVQELQFLGNYSFNKSIYTILHGAVKVFEYVVPHMGYFYQQPIQHPYTKSLLDMDQRQVKEQVSDLKLPVLIIHPVDDNYIPSTISMESHRLMPQSYFVSPDGSNQIYFTNPGEIVKQLNWFTELSDSGKIITKENASLERVSQSQKEFNPDNIQSLSRRAFFVLGLMIVLIATMSEDLGAISAGLLVASGLLPYWFAILITIIGIFAVDVSIYFLGKYVGRPVIEKVPFRWFIKEKDVNSAENTFNMRGVEIIFLSRFLPGARLPVYLVAGILKINLTFFLTYFFLAISIWAPLLIWLSAFVGEPILGYINTFQNYALWVFLALMLVMYLVVKLVVPLSTLKGRQRMVVKWRRFKEKFN